MEVSIAKLAVVLKVLLFSDSRMRENLLVQLLFNLLFGWTSPYYQNWYSEGKLMNLYQLNTRSLIDIRLSL